MRQIELREYGPAQVVMLSAEERAILRDRFGKFLSVQPTWTAGEVQISAAQHVGTIQIGDLHIRIVPKTPAANLFYMFSVAWDLPFDPIEEASLATADDIFEFIVNLFARQVEELARAGIVRAYHSWDDSFPFLRGRLAVQRQIGRALTAPGRFEQELHEFTPDIVDNQILAWALHTLTRVPWRGPLLTRRLRRVLDHFADVSLLPIRDDHFERLHYTRLNESYRLRHNLARLLLQMRSIEGSEGNTRFHGWLLDMNALFELFVVRYLEGHIRRYHAADGLRVERQKKYSLGRTNDEEIQTDILLLRGNHTIAVLDTKNKLQKDKPGDDDRRQMREYANLLRLPAATLIYAGRDPESPPARPTRVYDGLAPFTLHSLVWDLDGPLETFKAHCARLAEELVQGATMAAPVEAR